MPWDLTDDKSTLAWQQAITWANVDLVPCHHIASPGHNELTQWGLDKLAAILQTTYSHAFSRMKMYKFRLEFHWCLFLTVQLTIFQHCFRQWLGAVQATSHYMNQWWLDHRCIYATLCLNELKNIINRKIKVYSMEYTYNEVQCHTCWCCGTGLIKVYYVVMTYWHHDYIFFCLFGCCLSLELKLTDQ